MTDDSDLLARKVLDLVTEIGARQISRELAHLAQIEIDELGAKHAAPPEGYRVPSSGFVRTHVVAHSRDVPGASAEMRVAVWVAEEGSTAPLLLLTRAGDDRSLAIETDEIDPEPTHELRGRVNDYVALTIAEVVTELNVAMQHSYIHESQKEGITEYEES